jgi:uncharacterized protein YqgC (DUF456 family)
MTVFLGIVCAVLLLAGLVGVISPVLPGIQLSWLGFLIYAWGTGFERISLVTTIVCTGLMLLFWLKDYLVQVIGAKKFNASKGGLIGVFAGTILGPIIFGFWGIIIGPVIGAIVGELIAVRHSGGMPGRIDNQYHIHTGHDRLFYRVAVLARTPPGARVAACLLRIHIRHC